ncbi:MAG: glycosyltransferase [Anaerolineaceae bacterium]|nr:glycosyltransferase [Anaerolineaceae bacterium]
MNLLPRISIITPSLNQGSYIRQTIDSVLSQGYPNLEYIVVDGESGDQTISILESFGDSIMWLSEKDNGQADAVNKGM